MRYTEVERLRSEIGTVERLLTTLPEGAIIERMSWESRLGALRGELQEIEAQPKAHPLSLTFKGMPVEGSRSIDATFASKAVRAFVEATDTVTASMVAEDLRERGRLPGTRARSLRIVDTAVGSFGFELELPPPTTLEAQATLFPAESADPYVDAIATTLKLLDEAAADNEDAISDLVAEIHPRAAAKVRAFANTLAENGALVAVAFAGRQVRLDDEAKVKRVVASLADSDITETEDARAGRVLGVLPESRRFEARLADGKIIQGKVDRSVADIGAFKAAWENRDATLVLRVVRVRTRTRYALLGASTATEEEGEPAISRRG